MSRVSFLYALIGLLGGVIALLTLGILELGGPIDLALSGY